MALQIPRPPSAALFSSDPKAWAQQLEQYGSKLAGELERFGREISPASGFLSHLLTASQGAIIYKDAPANGWQALGAGTSGQVAKTGGASANPAWGWVATSELATASAAPSSGHLGELISSGVPNASAVSLTTGVPKDVTSISLSPGVWLCWGNVAAKAGGATTYSNGQAWLNTTSAAVPTLPNNGAYINLTAAFGTGTNPVISAGAEVVVVSSGTQSLFLSTQWGFGGSTLSAYGYLGALRVA